MYIHHPWHKYTFFLINAYETTVQFATLNTKVLRKKHMRNKLIRSKAKVVKIPSPQILRKYNKKNESVIIYYLQLRRYALYKIRRRKCLLNIKRRLLLGKTTIDSQEYARHRRNPPGGPSVAQESLWVDTMPTYTHHTTCSRYPHYPKLTWQSLPSSGCQTP